MRRANHLQTWNIMQWPNARVFTVCVLLRWVGGYRSTGWYDNSQPVLRPVFIVAQCITRVCRVSVCMGGAQPTSF